MRKTLCIALLALLCTTPSWANDELDKLLSASDKQRLEAFEKTEAAALAEGLRGGTPEEIDILTKALAGKPLPVSGAFDAKGNWKCRVIKVGGSLPITPYNWFKCRITEDEAGLFVEKISGSQRFTGRLYTKSETELVFVGAGHVNDDPQRSYGEDAEQDQVAIVTRRGENKLVFEFPAPKFESNLDVLVMER
ncbi:MAG: DUF4893 domain-containing protein [Rhizobiaceae bacterium]